MTITVVAARTPFTSAELFELRMLRDFYIRVRWVVSNIVEPRVVILEVTDPTAFRHLVGVAKQALGGA